MSPSESVPGDAEELRRLRAEVEELRREASGRRSARSQRMRGAVGGALTLLAVLATTLALLAVWSFRTLTDSDLFVERVGSIIEEPEVASAIGAAASAQLVEALDLEGRLADVLPDQLAFAAVPLTTAARDTLADGTTALVESEQFRSAWAASLRQGHALSIAILEGSDLELVQNVSGVVVLDLTPVVNALADEASGLLGDLLGRDVTAPAVSEQDVGAAVAALEEALDLELPADFGQVVLFEAENLAAAQRTYQATRAAVWLAPIAAAVLIGLAVAASRDRSRTALWIVVGTALALLVVAISLEPLRAGIVGSVVDEGLAGAVGATLDRVLGSLLRGVVVAVLLGALAAAGLFLTGDSRPAAVGRQALAQVPALAATHRVGFLVGGAVAGTLLLAAIPGRTWGVLLAVLLLYAGYALAVVLAPSDGGAGNAPDGDAATG